MGSEPNPDQRVKQTIRVHPRFQVLIDLAVAASVVLVKYDRLAPLLLSEPGQLSALGRQVQRENPDLLHRVLPAETLAGLTPVAVSLMLHDQTGANDG